MIAKIVVTKNSVTFDNNSIRIQNVFNEVLVQNKKLESLSKDHYGTIIISLEQAKELAEVLPLFIEEVEK